MNDLEERREELMAQLRALVDALREASRLSAAMEADVNRWTRSALEAEVAAAWRRVHAMPSEEELLGQLRELDRAIAAGITSLPLADGAL